MSLDFTLNKFRSLCAAVTQHYPTLTLAEYFQGTALPSRFSIMRHDVDRKPGNALSTARIEAEEGIRATYYFRRYGSAFRPDIIESRLGGTRQVLLQGNEGGHTDDSDLTDTHGFLLFWKHRM